LHGAANPMCTAMARTTAVIIGVARKAKGRCSPKL
jgi:hypothetical protein